MAYGSTSIKTTRTEIRYFSLTAIHKLRRHEFSPGRVKKMNDRALELIRGDLGLHSTLGGYSHSQGGGMAYLPLGA